MKADSRARLIPVLAILITWGLVEAASLAGLKLLSKVKRIVYDPNPVTLNAEQRSRLAAFVRNGKGSAMEQDPDLGWAPLNETNSAGMRDDREYEPLPAPGTLRIAAYGDSFTYGSDVKLHESWIKQLAASDPSLDVLNYGVGAYGPDQALLRYLKTGTDYHPDIVFIGYMSENLARSVNVFRGFYTNFYRDSPYTKPRYRLDNGRLELIPNPLATVADYARFQQNETQVLAELGRFDFHYQNQYGAGPFDFLPTVRLGKILWWRSGHRLLSEPIFHPFEGSYNPKSEAYQLTLAIIDRFHQAVIERGAVPVILIFPDLNDMERSRRNSARRYEGFLAHFRDKNYRFIDTLDILKTHQSRYSIGQLTVSWGHFSPLGSKLLAAGILENLRKQGLRDEIIARHRR